MFTRIDDKVVKDDNVIENYKNDKKPPHKPKNDNDLCEKFRLSLLLGLLYIILTFPFIMPEYINMFTTMKINIIIPYIVHGLLFIILAYLLLKA